MHNTPEAYANSRTSGLIRPSPENALGRLAVTKEAVQITDLLLDDAYKKGTPPAVSGVEQAGIRTLLAVPMLNDEELQGAIVIYRQEVRAFNDKQIDLLKNFAAKDVTVPNYAGALSGDIRGVRLGIPGNYFFDDVEPFVEQAVRTAIADLEALGAKAVPVSTPDLDGVLDCMLAIAMSEAGTYHQQAMRATPELFSDETRQLLEAGELTLATTYINAQRARLAIKNAFKLAMKDIDVLVTPTQPMTALKIGQTTSRIGSREESVFGVSARFCAPFNISGLPAMSVPCGFSPQGMPIGLQIIGKPFDEETVLRIADAFERSTQWHLKYPTIAA
jgi:Asp-tRNA(Asn)/Glu-tRNA(Gln) amidotransferase A subunit family amidase